MEPQFDGIESPFAEACRTRGVTLDQRALLDAGTMKCGHQVDEKCFGATVIGTRHDLQHSHQRSSSSRQT
jgi:hypothetical protein